MYQRISAMQADVGELTVAQSQTQLERIGQGRCGTVWAVRCSKCDGHSHLAMKREDGSTGRSISHEYQIHQKILSASPTSLFSSFTIPRSFGFLNSQDRTTWSSILSRLPENYMTCNAIVSEKIIPVQASTRRLLIQKFRPDVDEESIMNSPSNEHCLIRPYLGRRRYRRSEAEPSTTESRKRLRAFSLRNFPLHLDQMEQLGIDPSYYAMAMADALAFLHWVAKVDGNDVEFVLAQQRDQSDTSLSQIQFEGRWFSNINILGPHTMWVLDFDLCRVLTLDESGIDQASNAFWGNDPFYPRPGSLITANQKLWNLFEDRFLESSAKVMATESDQVKRLPKMLIEKIKQAKAITSGSEIGDC